MENILDRISKISEKESIRITSLEKKIGASKGVLSRAIANKTDIQTKWIQLIVENYPHISSEWLLTGKGTMYQKGNDQSLSVLLSPEIGVPYYNVDFIGGFELVLNDQTLLPAHNIYFPPFSEANLWCNVTGHSMEPKINHGDLIALKEVISFNDILFGEIYAIVMDEVRTIKVIRKSPNPEKLRFIPINQDYDEQEFDKKRILKIYAVLGSIRKFF